MTHMRRITYTVREDVQRLPGLKSRKACLCLLHKHHSKNKQTLINYCHETNQENKKTAHWLTLPAHDGGSIVRAINDKHN